jgi:hypothetical protein
LPIIAIAAIGSSDITWMDTMSAPTSVTSGRYAATSPAASGTTA